MGASESKNTSPSATTPATATRSPPTSFASQNRQEEQDTDDLRHLSAQLHQEKKVSRIKLEAARVKQIYQEVHDEHELAAHRFTGYVAALGRSLKMLLRYAAYSSDIGEAFRPVVNRNVVRGAYAVSWIYVIGDVSLDANDKYNRLGFRGWDLASTTTKRAVFQVSASMALPAFTIHSVVHYSKTLLFQPRFPQYLRWGPTLCGLGVVPFLPVMFDEPVEVACELIWEKIMPLSPPAHAKMKEEHAKEHEELELMNKENP